MSDFWIIVFVILGIVIAIGILRMLVRQKDYDGASDFLFDLFLLDMIFGGDDDGDGFGGGDSGGGGSSGNWDFDGGDD